MKPGQWDYHITRAEDDVIKETMVHYDLTPKQVIEAKALILERARQGGRFYPYHAAHAACSSIIRRST